MANVDHLSICSFFFFIVVTVVFDNCFGERGRVGGGEGEGGEESYVVMWFIVFLKQCTAVVITAEFDPYESM